MKKTKIISLLLAVALFVELSGCNMLSGTSPDPSPDNGNPSINPSPPQTMSPSQEIPSTEPTPTTPPPSVAPVEDGMFELPIEGATGYTAITTNLHEEPSQNSKLIVTLEPGIPFTILSEKSGYWYVESGAGNGWVYHDFCLINLPDVIPSIVYDSTNTYGSVMMSSGIDIPGITGQSLYNNLAYNERFGKDEYIMLALYSTAKKLCAAQQKALSEGNSIKLYEAYRPHSIQMLIVDSLTALANSNRTVMAGINTAPWSTGWFIAMSLSHHQRGLALDVGLVAITKKEVAVMGDIPYYIVTAYEEYEMPTRIHELSSASAIHKNPVDSRSETAWKDGVLADSMNEAALTLQRYFTSSGFVPLSSEWWHFNDLQTRSTLGNSTGNGRFTPDVCVSRGFE